MPHVKGDPTKPTDLGLRGIPLLDEIIRIAEAQPEHFDMKVWAAVYGVPADAFDDEDVVSGPVPETCGTAMCVAGWAAHLTGAEMVYVRDEYAGERPRRTGRATASTVRIPAGVQVPAEWQDMWGEDLWGGDHCTSVSRYAAHVLGLRTSEADELFYSGNSLETIKELRDELAARYAEEAGV